jgi:hypothetical protein
MRFDPKAVSRRIAFHALTSGARLSDGSRRRLAEIAMDGLEGSAMAELLEFLRGKLEATDFAKVKTLLGAATEDAASMMGLDHLPPALVRGTGKPGKNGFLTRHPDAARIGVV